MTLVSGAVLISCPSPVGPGAGIDPEVRYVHPTGTDAPGGGGSGAPFRSIQYAIDDLAAEGAAAGEVRVAAGTYNTPTAIVMKPGISVFGGYRADDWGNRAFLSPDDRENPAYKTVIRNTTTDTFPTNPAPSVYAVTTVYGGAFRIGTETVLEGFTLQAPGGVLVYSDSETDTSALTIRRNTILGNYAECRVGIQLVNSGGDILDNVIRLGDPSGTEENVGLLFVSNYNPPTVVDAVIRAERNRIEPGRNKGNTGIRVMSQSDVRIFNNLIRMSLPKDSVPARFTYGIDFTDKATGTKQIINNTFILPIQGTMSLAGVRLYGYDDSLKAEIVNNIFHFPDIGGDVVIEEQSTRGDVSAFRNNVVSYVSAPASRVLNQNGSSGQEVYSSPAGMDAWEDLPADKRGGTTATAPDFLDLANGDLRISGPPEVSGGGIPWPGISTDILGNPRTEPWSIGAYEKD